MTFYIAPDMKDWTKKGGKKIKDELFKHDHVHFSPAGYDILIPYIQKISMDTCLPLIPPTDRWLLRRPLQTFNYWYIGVSSW